VHILHGPDIPRHGAGRELSGSELGDQSHEGLAQVRDCRIEGLALAVGSHAGAQIETSPRLHFGGLLCAKLPHLALTAAPQTIFIKIDMYSDQHRYVGMAEVEPAASCSQISSSRSLDVARRCPTGRSPATTLPSVA
jgi:hypothetical protein